MDIKDLNKSQLLLLALLVSFITSVATGITVVALMDQAPKSISTPINRVVKQTVERIVPVESKNSSLTEEDKKLLQELKTVQNLSATLYLVSDGEENKEDKLLGAGIMLGETKMIINSEIPTPKDGEIYLVKNLFGESKVTKIIPGDGFTLAEFIKEKEPTPVGDIKTDAPTQ